MTDDNSKPWSPVVKLAFKSTLDQSDSWIAIGRDRVSGEIKLALAVGMQRVEIKALGQKLVESGSRGRPLRE